MSTVGALAADLAARHTDLLMARARVVAVSALTSAAEAGGATIRRNVTAVVSEDIGRAVQLLDDANRGRALQSAVGPGVNQVHEARQILQGQLVRIGNGNLPSTDAITNAGSLLDRVLARVG